MVFKKTKSIFKARNETLFFNVRGRTHSVRPSFLPTLFKSEDSLLARCCLSFVGRDITIIYASISLL